MDPQQEAVLEKIAWRIVPLLTLAYVVNYLDRTNIGFAALTMNQDLGFTATQFGVGAGILFVGYTVFEIPSNLALYRFGARRWIARIMITWGIVSALTALVVGVKSYYLARFALGVAEAGFFPGVAYYFAAWFPTQYRTRMLAWFLVAIPLSSVIGGPISGMLLELDGAFGLRGWQWLFIAEGLPAIILGVAVLRMLADRPETATWLSPKEREILQAMLDAERRERPKSSLATALSDVRVIILAVVQFGFTLGSYGVGIFLPQIIKTGGQSNIVVSFLAAIPYIFASVGMIWWAWHVDRTGKKIGNLTIACGVAALGLAASVLSGNLVVALAALTVALVGITSARAIFWPIPTRFLSGVGAAAGLAFINSIGTAGGFAGPYLMGFLKDFTGSFTAGLLAMAGILLLTTLLAACLKLVIKVE
ncbi:MAG TPA: MFS transporter [Xanthobacteraceae bacterium]|jgi:ACS family tartrate transporter-like MFS transporter|nr:MFS transporter [Xanthobacteraceae bacterium]